MTLPFVCNSGSEVRRALLPCSARLGRLGLPIALSSLNQAELLLSRVRARAAGMALSSDSEKEATDIGTDGAGADGLRAEEPKSTSAAVIAVNFHGKSDFSSHDPEFVRMLLASGATTAFLRPYVMFKQSKASSKAAHIEGERLYFLVVSCPEVPLGLHERLVAEANRIHLCKDGEIGFMHKTPLATSILLHQLPTLCG